MQERSVLGLGLCSGQHVLPHPIRLVVRSNLCHIQCRSIHADGHGVGVLELAPVPDDGLRAGIDGKSSNGQHGSWSINRKHNVSVTGDAKHTAEIGLLDGGRRFTLAVGRYQASSEKCNIYPPSNTSNSKSSYLGQTTRIFSLSAMHRRSRCSSKVMA